MLRGPTTVSFSVERTEHPAQTSKPPRPAGGRSRREKMLGARIRVAEEVDGRCRGEEVERLGRRRVEREEGSGCCCESAAKKGESRMRGEGDAGGGAHCGRSNSVRSGTRATERTERTRWW